MIEAILIIAAVVLDQLSKYFAKTCLVNGVVTVIPKILDFHYVENTGAAFSMLSSGTLFLTIISVIMSVVFIVVIYKFRAQIPKTLRILLALVAGGAIGNLIDRIVLGYVVDFIEFTFVNFAIFNVADIFVTLAGIGLICYLFFAKEGKAFLKEIDQKSEKKKEE